MDETLIARAKRWADVVKRDVLALWLAARDPRVPWYVKAICAAIAAYALSPIDLIPDFIPVLGFLDDVILLPLAIMLAVWLVPADLMAELREKAQEIADRPVSRVGAIIIFGIWIGAVALLIWMFWPKSAA